MSFRSAAASAAVAFGSWMSADGLVVTGYARVGTWSARSIFLRGGTWDLLHFTVPLTTGTSQAA